tara:strand:- start:186 stop:671 length:486 start_codon:yes stop_codon:yes gene_type:complete
MNIKLNSADKGAIGELTVRAHLIERGYKVYSSDSPSAPADLLALNVDSSSPKFGEILLIDVKTCLPAKKTNLQLDLGVFFIHCDPYTKAIRQYKPQAKPVKINGVIYKSTAEAARQGAGGVNLLKTHEDAERGRQTLHQRLKNLQWDGYEYLDVPEIDGIV